ncbi:DUF4129 domain-containing protein [Lentibacillus saliphilus]|uniref:DUF4129 domain-containing protein n=1 Tax=Lentibacillus saliphilus TaxID=2737028 RepID=UPI001C2F41B9|nr:DUF4129 domain-containing protein [Lentibacillus saliphilus]
MANVDEAREKLEKILADKEYQVYYEDHRSLLEVIWDDVTAWFLELLSNVFTLNPSNNMGDVIIVLIIAVVLVLLAITIGLGIRSVRRKYKYRSVSPIQSPDDLSWSYEAHLEKAEAYRSEAQYAQAARHVFLALLIYFNDIGWLEAQNWKTNWEYVIELRRVNRDGADAFLKLAHVFDEVFYGEHPMQQTEYEQYRHEADRWLKQDIKHERNEG